MQKSVNIDPLVPRVETVCLANEGFGLDQEIGRQIDKTVGLNKSHSSNNKGIVRKTTMISEMVNNCFRVSTSDQIPSRNCKSPIRNPEFSVPKYETLPGNQTQTSHIIIGFLTAVERDQG